VDWSIQNLNDVIDVYSWHTYNGGDWNVKTALEYEGWRKIVAVGRKMVKPTNKPIWIDEYGANKPDETMRYKPDYGNYLAQCVAAFIDEGVQTSLIWLLFDQQYVSPLDKNYNKDSFYNGVHRWGLTKWPYDSVPNPKQPYPAWYAYSLMSKYLGGRNQTTACKTQSADSLYVVATKPNGKHLSVMVVNASYNSKSFKVEFQKTKTNSLERHLYNPAEIEISEEATIIKTDKKIKISKNSFTDEIPARGVAIYTTIKR